MHPPSARGRANFLTQIQGVPVRWSGAGLARILHIRSVPREGPLLRLVIFALFLVPVVLLAAIVAARPLPPGANALGPV